jgi:hypothetical protein
VTEGGEDGEVRFHHLPAFSDGLLAQMFSHEVFALLLGEELISQALVEKIAGWRHSGFSVHSKVKALTSDPLDSLSRNHVYSLMMGGWEIDTKTHVLPSQSKTKLLS